MKTKAFVQLQTLVPKQFVKLAKRRYGVIPEFLLALLAKELCDNPPEGFLIYSSGPLPDALFDQSRSLSLPHLVAVAPLMTTILK